MMDPDDFVISRKRKKYKFAKFFNAANCFEFEDWQKQAADFVEIGAGTGLFSLELAKRYPSKRFVAIDVKADRLQKGAYEALTQGIENIVFLRARADQIDECIELHSVEQMWLTFPDPFPRERSARRRMTHPIYLQKYAGLLSPQGSFYLKHDNPQFFQWSLEQLVSEKWHIKELSFDLHESDLADDYKVETSYEQRWLGEGRLTHFVRAKRPTTSQMAGV
ncbi:MAG TPA: tRNA (guanosine(46)-N7)-methyltransferase TrmB [Candidatus Saccharimonadales bacterium]